MTIAVTQPLFRPVLALRGKNEHQAPFPLTAKNLENFSPLYFGAQKHPRTVLTPQEREYRQRAEQLAEAQWKSLPLLFQVHYDHPGHKISPAKMAKLQERLSQLSAISQQPALSEAYASVFTPDPKTTAFLSRERLFLDQVSLFKNLCANEEFGEENHFQDDTLRAILQGIEDDGFRDNLITSLATDAAWPARAVAGRMIDLVTDKQLREGLTKKLLKDPYYFVKVPAAKALALLEDDTEKVTLVRAHTEETGYPFHGALAAAVASLKDKKLMAALFHEFGASENQETRDIAAQGSQYLPEGERTDALIAKLASDPYIIARYFAAENAGKIQNPTIRDKVITKTCKDKTWNVRLAATKALKHMTDGPTKLQLALKAARSRNPNDRIKDYAFEAIRSLSAAYDSEKVRIFREHVNKKDWHAGYMAARLIGTLHNDQLKAEIIQEFCGHGNGQVIYQLAGALESIQAPQRRAELIRYAMDVQANSQQKHKMVYAFARSIESIQDEPLRDNLLEFMLTHSAPEVRRETLRTAFFPNEIPTEVAERLRQDPSPIVRLELYDRMPSLYTKEEFKTLALALVESQNDFDQIRGASLIAQSRDPELQTKLLPKFVARLARGGEKNQTLQHWLLQEIENIVIPDLKQKLMDNVTAGKLKAESADQDRFRESDEKSALNNLAKSTQDLALKTSLLKGLVRDVNVNTLHSAARIINKDIVPEINAFLTEVPYTDVMDEAMPMALTAGRLPARSFVGILQTLTEHGVDAKALPQVLDDLERFRVHALKVRSRFTQADNEPMSEQEMKIYLDDKTDILMRGMFVAGRGALLDKFDQKQDRFEAFLQTLALVLRDEDVSRRIYQVRQLPNRQQKEDAYQDAKLVELAYGFILLGKKDVLVGLLDEVLERKIRDLTDLTDRFMREFAQYAGLSKEEAQALSSQQIELWNPDYINTIPMAIKKYREPHTQDKNGLENFQRLIKATLQGNYQALLQDPESEPGQANLRTREAFEAAGLDYDRWLNYDQVHTFQIQLNGRLHRMSIRLWKRQPGHDIFQGNYAQACTAMGGMNGRAIAEALIHTFVQMAEIRDETLGKPIGKVQFAWQEDLRGEKEPVLLADNIQLAAPYRKIPDMVNHIRPFALMLGQEVANRPVKVVKGRNLNAIDKESEKELPTTEMTVRTIGDTASHEFFLSAYNGYEWQNIRRPHRLKFHQLYPPAQ
jgi:hypothetical protein